ncbi:MAG: ATP-binding protein [Spirochaetes bacterium]|nr:ATP-binding protein [Spirochaetota bacterium]
MGKRIYIVEDSRIVAMDLEQTLIGLGYEIAGIAGTGEEAVAGCVEASPDLVLMDVKLPGGLDGIAAAREIRARISVPVVYATAYSDRGTVEEIQKSFPFGFVVKPYREKDLLVALETAFTRFEYDRRLEESERRYKSLFEGANDIIFTLDEEWNIVTVNRAVANHLNLRPEGVVSKHFLDLLYVPSEGGIVPHDFVQEKMESFGRNRHPLSFKAVFRSNFNDEPVEMNVRLERIDIAGGDRIIGRAYRVVDDELLRFFHSETQRLVMGNQLFLAGDVAYRVTRNLKRYLDDDTVELVRLAFVEVLINAIEHGNLEISFREKTRALESKNYFEFISGRQADPRYRDRRVRIDFSIHAGEAVYLVADDGAGFDYEDFFRNGLEDRDGHLRSHGRGLIMARKIFDTVEFMGRGNEVRMVKRTGA